MLYTDISQHHAVYTAIMSVSGHH